MKNKLTFIATTWLLCTLFILPYHSFAQAGSLDLTFDTDGKVTTAFGSYSNVSAIALQSDGKIVVAGGSYMGSSYLITLVRYNINGSLDLSFDTDGKVTTAIGTNSSASSIAIQSDGKIVVAGSSDNGSFLDFTIVRYNSNGSLDLSFDSDGIVTTNIGNYDDEARSLAIQSDGKIVVAGCAQGSNYDFALVRYNTNGSLDLSFDADGKVTTYIGTNSEASSVAIQSDGKIVVAGANENFPDTEFALVRYNTNGSIDLSFDTDGIVTTAMGGTSIIYPSVAIQSDGKIVIVGFSQNGLTDDIGLVRYNTNGSLDLSFDTDGKVTTTNYGYYYNSIVIQSDGKILVTGLSFNGSNGLFALLRYNTNGSLDLTFDTDGIVTTAVGTLHDIPFAVALQNDGKILVAGNSLNSSQIDFALARYNNYIGTSINDNADLSTKIVVFPNPFSTLATLQTHEPLNNALLTFYNLYGQQVKQMNSLNILAGKTIELTRDNLPNGIYFIQLKEKNKIISTNKLVITD